MRPCVSDALAGVTSSGSGPTVGGLAGGLTAPVLGGPSAQRDYRVRMTPTHYLLDADGQIVFKHAGYGKGDAAKLEAAVQRAPSR